MRRPRDYPANRDDFAVIGPDGKVIGRIFKPGGGAQDWMWAVSE